MVEVHRVSRLENTLEKLKARRSVDTRSELLAHAEDLVRRRGYSGFSFADVSERAGVTKASIHYHFPTKDTLVAALILAYRTRYAQSLRAIESEYGGALDRIEAYGRLYLMGLEEGRGCLCAALTAELENLPAGLRSGTADFFREHLAWIERIYAEGLSRGEVNANLCSSAAARVVLASLEGALMMERLLEGVPGFTVTLRAIRQGLSPLP